jgi:hypothetical protein
MRLVGIKSGDNIPRSVCETQSSHARWASGEGTDSLELRATDRWTDDEPFRYEFSAPLGT